jgi:anti-sigma factor RsiW
MTDCPNATLRDRLPDLVNGRLSPDERRELEAHVGTCAECAAELALLRDLRASMARAPRIDPARVAAAVPAYRAPARRSWGGWRTAAAITAILVGGASVVVVRQDSRRGLDSSVPSVPSAEGAARAIPPASRELAAASGAASDLSDRELQALLKDIESIDAVPSVDVENPVPVTPVSPQGESE